MKRGLRNTFELWLMVVLLTACATVGLPTADTFNQKLAVGYGTVTQLRTSAADLLKAGKITKADAQNIQTQADAARAGLDVAQELSAKDMAGANNRLVMVTTILTAAQAYLSSR